MYNRYDETVTSAPLACQMSNPTSINHESTCQYQSHNMQYDPICCTNICKQHIHPYIVHSNKHLQ